MTVDIDFMNGYRDFTHDPVRFNYNEADEFFAKLQANNQHYVPMVDAAIYVPNPEDPSDAYPTYDRGVDANAFLKNPDGSTYYGAVWPGYTGNIFGNQGALTLLKLHSVSRLDWCCSKRHWHHRLVDQRVGNLVGKGCCKFMSWYHGRDSPST